MKKRTRFIIILAVLAVCLFCLWPSINWYFLTSKEDQSLALGSRDKIREYAVEMASLDYNKLIELANTTDENTPVPEEYSYLVKIAKKNYKSEGKTLPSVWSAAAVCRGFTPYTLSQAIEERYRSRILKIKSYQENAVQLGLDLSGGMSLVIKADLDAVVNNLDPEMTTGVDVEYIKNDAMKQVMEILNSRIDRFGLSEPVIRRQGTDRIYVEIPGASDSDRINSIVMGQGMLAFHLVDDEATSKFSEYYANNRYNTFDSEGNLLNPEIIPEDTMVLGYYAKDEYDLDVLQGYLVVKKEPALEGRHITSASVSSTDTREPAVAFRLDSEGAVIFGELTAANVGKNLCIVSDGKIRSYATIREAIPNGSVQLSGFSYDEAENISTVLKTAWLDVPLQLENQQVIGASMGAATIRSGLMALVIGLASVMVFMLIWYKGAGINAIVAQILNLYIMFSFLSAFNLTLSLSSIAGMILTIGMAVDANVVIFERIKDELRLGKDRASAVFAGFQHAFWAIMDSNITTFIAAMFLSQIGTGSIQGFAVSLAIGVISSVFTALFVSRLMFDFGTDVMKKTKISIAWRIK